jgi:DNA polymerase III delta prime subunit
MTDELTRKYRPTELDQVVGQPQAVAILRSLFEAEKIPHALIFTGPSGCGKTTLARITATELGCKGIDFQEINSAEERGIDNVRDLKRFADVGPMMGKAKVLLFDECHRLTNDAQAALLKITEDPPRRTYFMFATTDPSKVLFTLRSRCTNIPVQTVDDSDLNDLICRIIKKEKIKTTLPVIEKIVECAQGSAREAVKLLGSIANISKEKRQLAAVTPAGIEAASRFIGLWLMGWDKPKMTWPEVAQIIKNTADSDLESLRRGILGFAAACCVGGKEKAPPKSPPNRALLIMEAFLEPWYNCGRAGLVKACIEVSNS